MKQVTHNANDIAANAQFGGYEGNFTMQPAWVLSLETPVTFTITDDSRYVTQIEYNGWTFKHQNETGSNVHGGNHTTSEWFTFDISGFYLCNLDGSLNRDYPLNSKPGWQGVHTVTPRNPLPAPCFGPDVLVLTPEQGAIRVCDLKAGMHVFVQGGAAREVLWTGGRQVEINIKNRPIEWRGSVFSPQHRILIGEKWAKAKHLAELGIASWVEPCPHWQWYGHILLETHEAIAIPNGYVESLLPTERALSGMSMDMQDAIRKVMRSSCGLQRMEYSKFQLKS